MNTNNKLSETSSNSLSVEQTKALANYLPENFLPKIKTITTIKQAIENRTSSLSKISKLVGSQRTEGLIKVYLIRMNDLLDVKRPLKEEAMNEIANILITDYYNLTMVDVVFVFQEAIKGKYGEFYESLSIPKVIKWFEIYFHKRCDEAEEMSNRERNQHNSLFGRERSSEAVNEQREFSKQYVISQKIEAFKEATKPK